MALPPPLTPPRAHHRCTLQYSHGQSIITLPVGQLCSSRVTSALPFAVHTSLTDADDVTPVMYAPPESTSRLVREVRQHLEAHEKGLEGTPASSPFLKVGSLDE